MLPQQNKLSYSALFSTLAGLCGALGVVAYAGSAHGGDNQLGVIAPILLAHAPALLVLSLLVPINRTAHIAAVILMAGILLFCGDLLMRDITGNRLFPYAAPTGGTLMILGWLLVAVSGWFTKTS